jgi:hypothetical protein
MPDRAETGAAKRNQRPFDIDLEFKDFDFRTDVWLRVRRPGDPRATASPNLPTSLTVTEIADQLYLSVNTIRTHLRHVYDKLDARRRHEALDRARAPGLLAPSSRET